MKMLRIACLAIVAAITVATAHAENDPGVVTAAAGIFDVRSHNPQSFEGRISYRSGWGLWGSDDGAFRGLKPMIGAMFATNDAVFGYAGLAVPFQWGRFEIEPSAGMGAYHRGNAIDLGGTFEFHLGFATSYAITDRIRIGAELTHISNANTHRINPGLNSVLGTVSFMIP